MSLDSGPASFLFALRHTHTTVTEVAVIGRLDDPPAQHPNLDPDRFPSSVAMDTTAGHYTMNKNTIHRPPPTCHDLK